MRQKYGSELSSYQVEKLFIKVELTTNLVGSNHDGIVFITGKGRKAEHNHTVTVTLENIFQRKDRYVLMSRHLEREDSTRREEGRKKEIKKKKENLTAKLQFFF